MWSRQFEGVCRLEKRRRSRESNKTAVEKTPVRIEKERLEEREKKKAALRNREQLVQ